MRPQTFRCSPRRFPLADLPPVGGLLSRLRERGGLIALDSAEGWPGGLSLVAADPLVEADGRPVDPGARPSDLRALLARLEPDPAGEASAPFRGGFLGALAYDGGVEGEDQDLPADPWGAPLVVGGLYTDFVLIDHERARAALVLGADPGDDRAPLERRRERWMEAIEGAASAEEIDPAAEALAPPRRLVPPAEHRARIERAREWIAAGEFYQANLAHPFEVAVGGHPVDLYRRLRAANPSPYMAFVSWDDGAVLSASPELLLEVTGRSACTRPIKGTIRRSDDPRVDERHRRELLASVKDNAELAMIVDLERNDLGRVAEAGSVTVEAFPRLRSYRGLHHLTADVRARLRADADAVDALGALFPGGSITGAPKVRSMRAIAELEGEGRGFFTGSAGFVDVGGDARFNILIRTLTWRPTGAAGEGEVRYHVGGGITWSSDARAEDEETLLKGERLAAALAPATCPTGAHPEEDRGES
ncbi:MAG: anthranilate synthase component I family protein [Planctomycetota bacterium]|nr:anthranilate synthase component I family protein [Planctomycetota bacterium]